MADRFFVARIGASNSVRLDGDEAHHLARVSRVPVGGRVQLFDGSGVECEALVERIGRREVVLSVVRRAIVDRELPFPLVLGCALPKGDRLQFLIEKTTELGVTRFVPLLHERSTQQARGTRLDKLRRWVIEASKQCGRNVLMEVSDAMEWEEYLDSIPPAAIRIVAHPTADGRDGKEKGGGAENREEGDGNVKERRQRGSGEVVEVSASWSEFSSSVGRAGKAGASLGVGPEGGLTEREVAAAHQRGWHILSLGPRMLRVETAALALVVRLTGC